MYKVGDSVKLGSKVYIIKSIDLEHEDVYFMSKSMSGTHHNCSLEFLTNNGELQDPVIALKNGLWRSLQ